MNKIWIISEFFYPDENATGHLLTKIAEGLVEIGEVRVLSGQLVDPSNVVNELCYIHNGVTVERIKSSKFSKDNLILRTINVLTLSILLLIKLIRNLEYGDKIIVVTNPPTFPFIVALACWFRKANYSVLIFDVYPEVLIATGIISKRNPIATTLSWMTDKLLSSADNIVVLGRDMASLISKKYKDARKRVVLITNWGDVDDINPGGTAQNSILKDLSLDKKFIVQYIGNIGRTHSIELLTESAKILQDRNDIGFLFIGDGAKKAWLSEFVARNNLKNVTIKPFYPRNKQSDVHTACNIAVVSLIPGMTGVSVPSRMYNIMAAGKPIIAISDDDTELAMVVREENIGWVVSSYNAQDVVNVILTAKDSKKDLCEMGKRARIIAETKYSFEKIIPLYRNLISNVN
jgi:colanic acid biosynthesis glycosyl transferase WcaI